MSTLKTLLDFTVFGEFVSTTAFHILDKGCQRNEKKTENIPHTFYSEVDH